MYAISNGVITQKRTKDQITGSGILHVHKNLHCTNISSDPQMVYVKYVEGIYLLKPIV